MKKMSKALVVGASLLTFAGTAQAATHELNVTGASAQFSFWNNASKDFLEKQYGCTGVVKGVTLDGKRGYAKSTSCSNGDTYILRYTSNASYDGITALKGTADPDSCNGGTGTKMRKYAQDDVATYPTCAPGTDGKILDSCVQCRDTQLGASDVNGTTFTQVSKGMKLGPQTAPSASNGGINPATNVYGPAGTPTAGTLTVLSTDTTGLTTDVNHLAVPFAFYVNNGVTWKKCGGDNTKNFCMTDADCTSPDTCQSTTIDNITRLQAVLLFSGTVTNWNQFGGYFDAKPVVACLRHAGSGTHGTIDTAVMKGSWGKSLANTQQNRYATAIGDKPANVQKYPNTITNSTSAAENFIWFNNGTSDVQKCVSGQIFDTALGALQPARGDIGAIGYMDADQPNAATYQQVKYNGVQASRQAIRNGWYDYFSMQNMYYNPSDPNYANYSSIITNLIAYAQNPANLPANEANYWSTKGEMRFLKSADTAYPITKVTPTYPQTP